MKEAALKRLQKDGAIATYEILEEDSDGNVLEYKVRHYAVKQVWYANLLSAAYDKVTRPYRTGAKA